MTRFNILEPTPKPTSPRCFVVVVRLVQLPPRAVIWWIKSRLLVLKLILTAFFAFHLTSVAEAGPTNPKIKWLELKTEHFEVVFPDYLGRVAQSYAHLAENIHNRVFPLFREGPENTLIILTDHTDDVNGFANFLPMPHIVLYMNMPPSISDISHYEDWAEMLLLHEYVHILNMHSTHGFYTPLNYIFGSIIRPNALLPKWYLEGLAVELESRYTRAGRLRSPRTDALLRTMSLNGTLEKETIDRLNEGDLPSWPGGRRPYLLGGTLIHQLIREKDLDVVYKLNQRYSRRLPFLLDGPVEDELGIEWEELLEKTYLRVGEIARAQKNLVLAAPQKKYEVAAYEDDIQIYPNVSPDGKWMTFLAGDPYEGSSIHLVERTDNESSFLQLKSQLILRGDGLGSLSWLPDSSGFIYSKARPVDHYSSSSDLYLYQLSTKNSQRLTYKERASEAKVSLDGKSAYFVKSGRGETQIKKVELATKKVIHIVSPYPNEKFSYPISHSATELLVTRRTNGRDELLKLNLKTKKVQKLITKYKSIRQLKKIKLGYLFISDKSGIPNVYLLKMDLQSVTPLTNTLSMITSADYDPIRKSLLVSQLDEKGPKLFETSDMGPTRPISMTSMFEFTTDSDLLRQTPSPRYFEKSNSKSELEKKDNPSEATQDATNAKLTSSPRLTTEYPTDSYKTLKYFIPKYWIPFVYPIEDGVLFQGTTSAGDPVGHHGYLLNFSYDSLSTDVSYFLSYTNSMTSVDYNLSYGSISQYRAGSGVNVQTDSASLTGNRFLSNDNTWAGGFGVYYSETNSNLGGPSLKLLGPSLGVGYTSSGSYERDPKDNIFSSRLLHQYFVENGNYTQYQKSFLNTSYKLVRPMKARHSLGAQLVASHAPEINLFDILLLGETTLGGNYAANLINSSFLLRGYPSGTFTGKSMAVVNLEYGFPLFDINKGYGTLPLFLRTLTTNLFVDVMMMDGLAYDSEVDRYFYDEWKKTYSGAGAEFVLNTNSLYHLPLYFKVGLYYGFEDQFQGGFHPFFTIGFSSLDAISNKNSNKGLFTF